MQWTRPKKRAASSLSFSDPAPYAAAPLTANGRSLSQTMLDAICTPDDTWYRTFLLWQRVLVDEEEYPTEELVAEAHRLGPEITRLKAQQWEGISSQPEISPDGWLALRRTLKKRQARMAAIEDILARRARLEPKPKSLRMSRREGTREGARGGTSLKGSQTPGIATAAPEPSDPFADQ